MRKMFMLFAVVMCILFSIGYLSIGVAEEIMNQSSASKSANVVASDAGKRKMIDLSGGTGMPANEESARVMPGWESTDENTGMPDVVPSDVNEVGEE